MTLSRFHIVLLILMVVGAGAVAVAVYYIENVFKEREEFEDKVREGRAEDLIDRSKEPPHPARTLDRPTSRSFELVTLTERASQRKAVLVRGNGEFVRLPSRPDETGPLVTGILDAARVDALITALLAGPPGADGDPYEVVVRLSAAKRETRGRDRGTAAPLLELSGREMNRGAIPERTVLKLAPSDGAGAAPIAWPFKRAMPEAFVNGAGLTPESDRVAFRQALLALLAKDARFSRNAATWMVAEVALIP